MGLAAHYFGAKVRDAPHLVLLLECHYLSRSFNVKLFEPIIQCSLLTNGLDHFNYPQDCGDESETVVLWVITLQQMVAAKMPATTDISALCSALHQALMTS